MWKNLIAIMMLLAGVALFMGISFVTDTITITALILFGCIGIFLFLQRAQYRRNLLVISIFGFVLGWRGIDFSPSFIVYPTELFIWFGFIILLADQLIHGNIDRRLELTRFEVLLAILSLVGVITALGYGRPWLEILFPFKSFLVFVPMMMLFRSWIHEKEEVYAYVKVLVVVGVIISALGLIERYVPAIAALSPSIMPGKTESRYNFEFGSKVELAGFNAWGTPVVSTLLVLLTGLAAFHPLSQRRWSRYLQSLILAVLILAIIAAGYRSAWLGLSLIILLVILFNRAQILASLPWVIPGVVYLFSSAYLDRLKTLLYVFGSSQDPSLIRRSAALRTGLDILREHPLFGTGWGASTSFNDWVNIGVAIGMPGLLILVLGYGWLLLMLMRYARTSKKAEDRSLHLAFFVALSAYAIAMISGAMSQVFPIMTGFWFVFCLANRLREISSSEETAHGEAVRATANL